MEKIADIADKLRPVFDAHQVALAYLFGSYAQGKQGRHSDVDVAVVFDTDASEQTDFARRMKLAGEVSRLLQVPDADVINLKRAADPLIKYHAIFTGQPIFVKDRALRFAIERATVREYEDTRSLRRIASAVLRGELASGTFGKLRILT
jgi:uncharacterized protein